MISRKTANAILCQEEEPEAFERGWLDAKEGNGYSNIYIWKGGIMKEAAYTAGYNSYFEEMEDFQ